MAVRTSTQAGNWSSTSTWGGSAAPGNGDQAIIGHAVAVDTNTTVGTSSPSTPDGASSFQPTLSASAGGTLTALPTGAYNVCYTNVDAGGGESSRSPESGAQTWTIASSKPRVTLPALPTGVSSRNVYLTVAGGASGTETLYASGVTTTTFDFVSALWTNGTTTQAGAVAFPNSSAIQINGTSGTLTINTSVVLTCRGDVGSSNGPVTLGAASVLELDASAANSPTNTRYYLWLGTAGGQTSSRLTTSGASWVIRSNAGGGNGAIGVLYSAGAFGLYHDCGWFTISGSGTFLRLGTATQDAISFTSIDSTNVTGNNFTGTSSTSKITFDTCGRVNTAYSTNAATPITFTSCQWQNTVGGVPLRVTSAATPTASRTISQCYFDTVPAITPVGMTVNDTVFNQSFTITQTGVKWVSFVRNLVRAITTTGIPVSGDLGTSGNGCYILQDAWGYSGNTLQTTGTCTSAGGSTLTDTGKSFTTNQWTGNASSLCFGLLITAGTGAGQLRYILTNTATALTLSAPWTVQPVAGSTYSIFAMMVNPHIVTPDTGAGACSMTGCVAEFTGCDPNGDFYYTGNSFAYTLKNNILLPNGALDNGATFHNIDTNAQVTNDHNTYFTGFQSAAINDFNNGTTGMILSLRSNIAWCYSTSHTGALGPFIICDMGYSTTPSTNPVTDPVALSGGQPLASNNCRSNQSAGNLGGGYNVNQVTGTCGANDVNADPLFVDRTRTFAGWSVSQGSVSTLPANQIADGIATLKANPLLVASSLMPYLQAGFAPTNSLLKNAGHDGVTIGAIEGVFGNHNQLTLTGVG